MSYRVLHVSININLPSILVLSSSTDFNLQAWGPESGHSPAPVNKCLARAAYRRAHSWRHGDQRADVCQSAAAPHETHRTWSVSRGTAASGSAHHPHPAGESARCPSTAAAGADPLCPPRTCGTHAYGTRRPQLRPSDWWRHDRPSPYAACHLHSSDEQNKKPSWR